MLVSIVIPTKNEEENIASLLSHFNFANRNQEYEILVVDDSKDNTAKVALRNGARVVEGQHQGLGQAIIDGIEASQGDIVTVMDADGSHNPSDVPRLINSITKQGYDMVIGSRYVGQGSTPGWGLSRRVISRTACLLAFPVTRIKDTTSGFFAFRKSLLQDVQLKPSSWKIMLEVLIKAKPSMVVEVPIIFEERHAGKSSFSTRQVFSYLKHLMKLYRWKISTKSLL